MGEPRTWMLPTEPSDDVTAVRDADGFIWTRDDDGWTSHGTTLGWQVLLVEFGPLTDVNAVAVDG